MVETKRAGTRNSGPFGAGLVLRDHSVAGVRIIRPGSQGWHGPRCIRPASGGLTVKIVAGSSLTKYLCKQSLLSNSCQMRARTPRQTPDANAEPSIGSPPQRGCRRPVPARNRIACLHVCHPSGCRRRSASVRKSSQRTKTDRAGSWWSIAWAGQSHPGQVQFRSGHEVQVPTTIWVARALLPGSDKGP